MPDYYHGPALILTALLLPAFGYLSRRFRDTRTLLWFLSFFFSLVWMVLVYLGGPWHDAQSLHPWLVAFGQASIQLGSALFLASMSPLGFYVGRFHVLYVIPYTVPLVIGALLIYGVCPGTPLSPLLFVALVILGPITLLAALAWNGSKGVVPQWLSLSYCAILCSIILRVFLTAGPRSAFLLVVSANLFMTALLVAFNFRRISAGVFLGSLGFAIWSLTGLQVLPAMGIHFDMSDNFIRVIVMSKVVAAIGMILLALEDELAANMMARARERRARQELEAYTRLILSRRRVEDFDRQGDDICRIIVEHSRFAQVALMLEDSGRYRLAGSVGHDEATVVALASLVARIPIAGFLDAGFISPTVEKNQALNLSQTFNLDLTPWMNPGDDLKRLCFTSALAVPMRGRSHTEGALLLSGLRPAPAEPHSTPGNPLRPDDLLPIEMLAARLQATRSQTAMFEKLIDSERFASLGQLAANVTHQLNNPLTVILGYASLLEESVPLDAPERRGVESILTESRRMRATLESLLRIARPQSDQLSAVSVEEMLVDLGQLYRSDFLERSIEFRLNIAPSLPRVLCGAQQLRQAVLHCLQYSIAAVENNSASSEHPKTIRLEASIEGKFVQILVAHSGQGFTNPERAFDPFTSTQTNAEVNGLGLSLCSTILRDYNGHASAMNLDPHGAAIILELQSA
jgi:signal transduction histidine kinase